MTNKQALKKTIKWYENVITEAIEGSDTSFVKSDWGTYIACSFCIANRVHPFRSCGACPLKEFGGPRCTNRSFRELRGYKSRYNFNHGSYKKDTERLKKILELRYTEILWACRELL